MRVGRFDDPVHRTTVRILPLFALALSLVLPLRATAQTGTVTPWPDLTGIWDNSHIAFGNPIADDPDPEGFIGPGGIPFFGFSLEEPEMLPWAAAKYKERRTNLVRGPWDRGNDDFDPILEPAYPWHYFRD